MCIINNDKNNNNDKNHNNNKTMIIKCNNVH